MLKIWTGIRNWTHSRHLGSTLAIWLVSLASGICVFGIAIFLQWLVYDDWMHDHVPVRLVGSGLAAALGMFVVMRWQFALRRRREEMLRRFETIRWMNDRIRNSLQKIDLLAFANNADAAEAVSGAVDAIEDVLHEVLAETHPAVPNSEAQPAYRTGRRARPGQGASRDTMAIGR